MKPLSGYSDSAENLEEALREAVPLINWSVVETQYGFEEGSHYTITASIVINENKFTYSFSVSRRLLDMFKEEGVRNITGVIAREFAHAIIKWQPPEVEVVW